MASGGQERACIFVCVCVCGYLTDNSFAPVIGNIYIYIYLYLYAYGLFRIKPLNLCTKDMTHPDEEL